MAVELTDTTPPSSAIPRPDPRNLTSLPQILSSLSDFESQEAELSTSLTDLLAASEPITQSLSRLQSLAPQLDDLLKDASILSRNVSSTAKTAERIGGRVQSLDEEMRRIREASDRVSQVIDLKVCYAIHTTVNKKMMYVHCFLVIVDCSSIINRGQ